MGTWYTNKASFLTAVTGEITDTYNDLSGFYTGPLSRLSGKVGYSAVGGLFIVSPNSTVTLSTNDVNETLAIGINTLASEFNSAGGTFNITDSSGFSYLTGTVTFEFYDGAVLIDTYTHIQNSADQFFIGYVPSIISGGSAGELKALGPGSGLYIGTSEVILGLGPDSSPANVNIDTTSLDSIESFGSDINILAGNIDISINPIESSEDTLIEFMNSQSFIDITPIQSQETFNKPIIWPTPNPGQIYFWYEQIHSIEFELNVRSKS